MILIKDIEKHVEIKKKKTFNPMIIFLNSIIEATIESGEFTSYKTWYYWFKPSHVVNMRLVLTNTSHSNLYDSDINIDGKNMKGGEFHKQLYEFLCQFYKDVSFTLDKKHYINECHSSKCRYIEDIIINLEFTVCL